MELALQAKQDPLVYLKVKQESMPLPDKKLLLLQMWSMVSGEMGDGLTDKGSQTD